MEDAPPRLLVSVCKGSECRARGADALFDELTRLTGTEGDRIRVVRGGCWGLCNLGANVVVRQGAAAEAVEKNVFGGDATFGGRVGELCYGAATVESVRRVAAEHLLGGKPVVELALTAAQRKTAVKLSKD